MDKQYEKNMKLKVTIAATAVAITLQTIIQLQYLLPVYEWCGDIYYPVLGMVQLFVGILIGVCMPMMGWTLYKNRAQLPKLSLLMRTEALIICGLIGAFLVWNVGRYSIDVDKLSLLPNIGSWLKMVSYTLLSVLLWQMACTKNETFASEEIGRAGRLGAWVCVIFIVVFLASIAMIVTKVFGEVSVEMYGIIGIVVTIALHLILGYWLAYYCYYNNVIKL